MVPVTQRYPRNAILGDRMYGVFVPVYCGSHTNGFGPLWTKDVSKVHPFDSITRLSEHTLSVERSE